MPKLFAYVVTRITLSLLFPLDKFLVDSEVSKRRPIKGEPKELQKWSDGSDIHQTFNEISLDSTSVSQNHQAQ